MEREETSNEGQLLARIRRGDRDAGACFVRDYYPRVYRYLLWLTGRPEVAEDLAQETFLRAWRHLDRFDDRASVRPWLSTIAHREFLRFLRGRRAQSSLEELSEVGGADATPWAERVEWRELIRSLPPEEGEVVVLHYLQGYDCGEIARIVSAPVTTIKYRLARARTHLQQALGEGDL